MAITFRGNPTTPRKEWPNRATSLIVAIPSLLVTTLAPLPSTDVVRAPLVQQAKAWPEVRANTPLGSPITLLAAVAAPAPIVPALHYPPARFWWQPQDTCTSVSKVLTADKQLPFEIAPPVFRSDGPKRNWLPADTSQGQSPVLKAIAAPFVPVQYLAPLRFRWLPADTSQASPLDPQLYYGPLPPAQFSRLEKSRWLPANTSQGQSPVLKAIAVSPFVPVLHASPVKPKWQPADTSADTPKPAFSDAQPPVFVAPQFVADRVRAVVNTTLGTPAPALSIPLPPGQFAFVGLQRTRWQPLDTSQSAPKVTYSDAIAAFVPAPQFGPLRYPGLPADTSHGTAKVVVADVQAPVFDAPQYLVERGRPVVDTSHSTPVELFAIALPPGQASFVGLQRVWWQPPDTSASAPKPTYADKQSPTFVAPGLQVVRPPQVADTSQSSALVDTIAPFVPAQYFVTPRYPWLPANTSASSGKVTYRDAVPAIVPPPHLAPQRYPSLPADTSHGIAKVAFGDAVPAFVALPYFAPQRYPSLPADTSRGDSVLLQVSTPNALIGDVGVLALTGIAGSIGQTVNLVGDVGQLVLTGQSGSVDRQDNQLLAGSVGTLILSGVAGVIQQSDNLAGDSGLLLLTGIAGSIQQNTTLAGDIGTLVLTGQAGSVDRQDNQFLAGDVGTLVLAGQAGAVGQSVNLDGAIGSLSLSGGAGSVNQSFNLVGSVGALSLSGIAGAVDRQDNQFLAGNAGALVLTGIAGAVDVSTGTMLVGDVGQLILTGIAGAIDQTQNQFLAGAVGSLSLTGIAGSIPSSAQEIIVGPSRSFFTEPIRLRLVVATIRTAQVQTVRGHGFVDVLARIRTAQASQSVRADASARVDAESNTSHINRSEAFGDARIRVSIVSQQSTGIYELIASALAHGEITSGLFAADTPPEYDGPEDDDILPDLIRKAT